MLKSHTDLFSLEYIPMLCSKYEQLFLKQKSQKKVFEAEKPCEKNRRLMTGFNTM